MSRDVRSGLDGYERAKLGSELSPPSFTGSSGPLPAQEPVVPGDTTANSAATRCPPASTCIEHQAGRGPLRLSFQIKVF